MGRPLRIILNCVTYHVFSRCIDKKPYMKKEFIRDLMLKIIIETQEKYDFEFVAFEILDNHFHFLIKTTKNGESISKIMQRIKSVFAKRFNKIHGRSGPLWNERYGCKIIENQENPAGYFLYLLWYLAYNSFRKSLSNNPRHYKYSSINHYLIENYQNKYNIKIKLHEFFIKLGSTFKERLKRFLEYEKIYLEKLSCQCQR